MTRTSLFIFAVACATATMPQHVAAQSYPVKPLRLIVPFPPGGGSDAVARHVATELSAALGQQVVIENRPGAQGSVGAAAAAKAPPDGYTILLSFVGTLAMNPWIYKETGYDPLKDFAHITLATSQPPLVVVNPRVPASNLKELAALAKTRPDRLSYASSSSSGQLTGELFKLLTHTKLVHVPYKGGGPAMIDVVGGHVDLMFASPPSSMPMVKAGKLRAIAVAGPKRLAVLPDVMTAQESGFTNFEVNGWYGFAAPANTPREIIVRLNTEIARVLASPAVRDRLMAEGLEPKSNSPEEMTSYVRAEYERWGKVVKAARLNPE